MIPFVPCAGRLMITAVALVLAVSCGKDPDCTCTYNCDGDVQYCYESAGDLLCFASLGALFRQAGGGSQREPDVNSQPADSSGPLLDVPADGPGGQDADGADQLARSDSISTTDVAAADSPDLPPEPQGPFELRGIWVTRWDYGSAADIETIMDNVHQWGFNAVFFQVRGTADAYYHSALEPWAKGLTGTLGKDPGWDPLQVAVDEGQTRGLEVHAWLNTFPAWSGTSPPPGSDPPHILAAHPEWRMVDADGQPMGWNNSYTWVSPGIPDVREHIQAVVVDIVGGYDVSGIHLDYIRYAGPDYSNDKWSIDAFTSASQDDPTLTWADFQRSVITEFVSGTYDAISEVAPEVKLSAAVWGIYKDAFGWGGTSEGFYDYYQDSHRWTELGIIDAICPMVYWPLTDPKGGWTDMATLTDDHLSASHGRHVYIGLKGDQDLGELTNEIEYIRQVGGPGYVVFAYSSLETGDGGQALADSSNQVEADVPPMPWK